MNLWKILKKVGGVAITASTGGTAGAILAAVNAALPSGKQLPENATGDQAMAAIDELPTSERAAILDKQFDVKIEEIRSWTSIQEAHAAADATGSSTRPDIAYMMAWVVAAFSVVMMFSIGYAVFQSHDPLKEIKDLWPLALALMTLPSALLRAYFGMRTEEKKARYNTAAGHPAQGIAGALMGRFLNRK